MSTPVEGDSPAQEEKAPKPKVSPVRNIIGILLLIVFVTVAVLEWNANRQATAAVDNLTAAMDDEERDMLTLQEVQALTGKAPDGPLAEDALGQKTTFTWNGVFRSHVLTMFFTREADPRLLNFTTDSL